MAKIPQVPNSLELILDLVRHGDYINLMNDNILKGTGVSINDGDQNQFSRGEFNRRTLLKFCRENKTHWPRFCFDRLENFWLEGRRWIKHPAWDLLTTCTIDGDPGILLVEAKNYERDLNPDGKPPPMNRNQESLRNHDLIGSGLDQAAAELSAILGTDINISRDDHYQLSNRVASAWILASCRIPSALLYLGFLGAPQNSNQIPFSNVGDWRQAMEKHIQGILPSNFAQSPILISGGATMRMIIESLEVNMFSRP